MLVHLSSTSLVHGRHDGDCLGGSRSNVLLDNDASQKDGSEQDESEKRMSSIPL